MNRDVFENLSPLDHRYLVSNEQLMNKLAGFFSENAFVRHQLKVEAALAETLAQWGICPYERAAEIVTACDGIQPVEVYAEEERTQHNVRALTNCIAKRVSEEARPYIHLTATSVDILDTANALRFREANRQVLLPGLLELERVLIDLARREKDTLQIGRTHGQFAVPVTFGFAVSEYVARLGDRILLLEQAGDNLRGKMAGAVGAYNASALIVPDPIAFELAVLKRLGLKPGSHSTQIVAPEFLLDYLHAVVACFGVLANLADDFRHLQRSELAEIGEAFGATQVGSSTMPHKRNPWNFEHVKSLWKVFMPRFMTLYMDQISEHQRDLTNSASGRFAPEIVIGLVLAVDRLTRVLRRLTVDRETMRTTVLQASELYLAEPLYILLAAAGHPDAHEAVRRLTLEAETSGRTLRQLLSSHSELQPYLEACSPGALSVLDQPAGYLGAAVAKTEVVCDFWEDRLATLFSTSVSG